MIASSLFHFTRNITIILKIIKSKSLRASLNLENVQNFFPGKKFISTPMICFCDIPLKFISENHTKRYGEFGLGFKKDWGIRKKINPIFYRMDNSDFSTSFNKSSLDINNLVNKLGLVKSLTINDFPELEDIQYLLGSLQANSERMAGFVKSYKEEFRNKSRINYIDREWRWVPEKSKKEFHEFNNKEYRERLNNEYLKKPDLLEFEFNDLNYIIVKTPDDIGKLIKKLNKLPIEDEEKLVLSQKIIDIKSINSDM